MQQSDGAVGRWVWELPPDDYLMRDELFVEALDWVNSKREFTRGQYLKACDEIVDGKMPEGSANYLLKEIALEINQNYSKKWLIKDDDTYRFHYGEWNERALVTPSDVELALEQNQNAWLHRDTIDDGDDADIEERRYENREDMWNELEELDYFE